MAPSPQDYTEAFYKSAQMVSRFMEDVVNPAIKPLVLSQDREKTMYGLFLRASAWMRSLGKLNGVSDFQAIESGVRTLLETAVDLALLHHDRSGTAAKKIEDWEMSAKLKHAECLLAYFTKLGIPVPHSYRHEQSFVGREQAAVKAARLLHWPGEPGKQGRHPQRWTDRTLGDDCKEADGLHGSNFEETYETKYRRICLNVHGSGLAGVRGLSLDSFHALCGLGFATAADLGMESSKLALLGIGSLWDQDPAIRTAFDNTDIARKAIIP